MQVKLMGALPAQERSAARQSCREQKATSVQNDSTVTGRLRYLRGVLLVIALAGALLPQAAAPHPDNAEAHLGKGYDALRQEQYNIAAAEFRAALRLDPKLVMRARFPLGVALFELKQPAEARQEFEAVRRAAGDQPNVAYYLGRLDLLDRNYASAVRNLTAAMAQPPFPDTAYYLGVACFKRGDLPAAGKWLREAARINPRDALAPYQLGMLYRQQGREEEAHQALARSAELRRRDAEESRLRTECGLKLDAGPRQQARAFCQKLYDPGSAERLTALGTLYGQHGDFEAALDPLRRAAELEPQSPQTQYNLAWTYYQLHRLAEAREPLARAVERWPDLFPLNALYGAVLARLGEDQAAYHTLGRAHQLNPRDQSTTNLLYTVTLRLAQQSRAAHQESEARRYSEEAARLRPGTPP
jgi:tetratricopeptide (TPR) repeat protein